MHQQVLSQVVLLRVLSLIQLFFKLFQTKTVQTGVILNKLFHCAAHV